MKKKILISLFLIIVIIESIIPIKANAAELQEYDTKVGIILEPTVELVLFIADSIMTGLSSLMTHTPFDFVMKYEVTNLEGEATAPTIPLDMSAYESGLNILRYPNFTYSPEEIFAGKIDLLDINFIKDSNEDESWQHIRNIISQWYKVLRMVAIIGLLSVLIYTGIKIIISSSAKNKAKYKEWVLNWFIAVVLVFSLHYIMAFMLEIVEQFIGLLKGLSGIIEVTAGDETFKTNLIGLVRFKIQESAFSSKLFYLVMYIALITYTIKFTFLYLKRVLNMAFLTIISPIVALTYPIDKLNDGKAQGFEMWIKEFLYNILLQPMHYILYYILVSTSLTLAATNPLYGVIALMFISQAEKFLKQIFGFNKAKGGTVKGIAGAFATGAVTATLMNIAKNPDHPIQALIGGTGKNGSGKKGGSGGKEEQSQYTFFEELSFIMNDTKPEDFIGMDMYRTSDYQDEEYTPEENETEYEEDQDEDENILGWRNRGSITETEQIEEDTFDRDAILEQKEQCELALRNPNISDWQREALSERLVNLNEMLNNGTMASELGFDFDSGIPGFENGVLIIGGDNNDDSMSLEESKNGLKQPNQAGQNSHNEETQQNQAGQTVINGENQSNKPKQEGANNELKKLQQSERRKNNVRTLKQGLNQQNQLDQPNQKNEQNPTSIPTYASNKASKAAPTQKILRPSQKAKKNKARSAPPVIRGVANVGKAMLKPAWDLDKDARYNAKKLARTAAKGVIGLGLGITAATVQAGISITDGKYTVKEGIATVTAGMVGAEQIGRATQRTVQGNRDRQYNEKDEKALKDYTHQWYNRDDIISNYNRDFPGKAKEMRDRAARNYVSRGVTDFKEQKQAIKYAEQLKEEKGMKEEDADRLAVATLRYKQNVDRSIFYDEKRRKKFIDSKVDTYAGTASKDSIRRVHEQFAQNVIDFDRANGVM